MRGRVVKWTRRSLLPLVRVLFFLGALATIALTFAVVIIALIVLRELPDLVVCSEISNDRTPLDRVGEGEGNDEYDNESEPQCDFHAELLTVVKIEPLLIIAYQVDVVHSSCSCGCVRMNL